MSNTWKNASLSMFVDGIFLTIIVVWILYICIDTTIHPLLPIATNPGPTPATQTEHTTCDVSPPIGSLLQHIEKVRVDEQDWYIFQCAGWEYGTIRRSVQELLITFDPAQKEPSPRCWISKPQTEQRITALHLEFASPAQLQNMLTLSPAPQH